MTNLLSLTEYHQSGNLPEAEKLYRAVLQEEPHHLDAMALLGLVCGAKGEHDEAIALIERAALRDPKSPLSPSARQRADECEEIAAGSCRLCAIALQPGMPQAWYNMANAMRADGNW